MIEDLRLDRFPILTTRKMFTKGILGEYAAFLRGPKHVDDFKEWGCNYWDLWADEDGNLELDYGRGWIKQFNHVIEAMRAGGNDRRMLVNTWNHERLDDLSLPCCHYSYQFYKRGDEIDLLWNQRSADLAIGVPSDIILAATMLVSLAREVALKPGRIKMVFGDAHIYTEHGQGVEEMLKNTPYMCPQYDYKHFGFFQFQPQDLELGQYSSHEAIKFQLKA